MKTTYYMICNISSNIVGRALSFEARDHEEAFAIINAYKAGLSSQELNSFTLEFLSTHKSRGIDFQPMVRS